MSLKKRIIPCFVLVEPRKIGKYPDKLVTLMYRIIINKQTNEGEGVLMINCETNLHVKRTTDETLVETYLHRFHIFFISCDCES